MRLAGIPIAIDGLLILLYLLQHGGRAGDLALADRINQAAMIDDTDTMNVALSPTERDTLLGVLDDPPDPLAELRAVIMRDHG